MTELTRNLLGTAAASLTIIAYFPYTINTVKRKITPNRTSWLVISLLGAVTVITYGQIGARESLWVAVINAIGPLMIFILSLKYGEGWNNAKDLKYLLGSILALFLWWLFNSPLLGLICNLFADFIGFFPTILKSWLRPASENMASWGLFVAGGIISLIAIDGWQLNLIVYPMYIILAEGTVFLLLIRGKFLNTYEKNKEQESI